MPSRVTPSDLVSQALPCGGSNRSVCRRFIGSATPSISCRQMRMAARGDANDRVRLVQLLCVRRNHRSCMRQVCNLLCSQQSQCTLYHISRYHRLVNSMMADAASMSICVFSRLTKARRCCSVSCFGRCQYSDSDPTSVSLCASLLPRNYLMHTRNWRTKYGTHFPR